MGRVIYDERWNRNTLSNLDRIVTGLKGELVIATDKGVVYAVRGVALLYKKCIESRGGFRSTITAFGEDREGKIEKIVIQELKEMQSSTI